jgi:Asp-tRNA(Asn)/Glu-tRNA(Gln) amidotransferase A subunit family amidase
MSAESGEVASIVSGIYDGELTAAEVVERHLRVADEGNEDVNAFVTRTAETALELAARIDEERPPDLPLLGVPFTVKDTIQTRGVETTAGSLLLTGNVPAVDATAVARLKAAGAVMVGKTNCPEFAMDIHTANRVAGVTRNPLDTTRTSGGSSGGDSAAVAAGFAVFGLGTDYGSSIRWPAHCTGLTALRPTTGRVPATGLLPNSSPHPTKPSNSLSVRGLTHTIGPIARNVADLRTIFAVLSRTEVRRFDSDQDVLDGLGVAWFDGDGNIRPRTDVAKAVEHAADLLARSGPQVEFRRPPGIEAAAVTMKEMRDADGLLDVERLAAGREELLTDTTRRWLETARSATVAELQDLTARRDALRADAEAFMADWPIWVMPVATIPAFELDHDDPSYAQPQFEVDGRVQARYETMAPCWAISLYGFPAVVVPCGVSTEGLPLGVQIVGPPDADEQVLEVASRLESLVRADTVAAPYPGSGSR